MRTSQAQAALAEAIAEKCGTLVIGPAGENLVKYAAVFSGERAAGRAGLGAVLGSKNLKAIAARGSARRADRATPTRSGAHQEVDAPRSRRTRSPAGCCPRTAPPGLVRPMQRLGILATQNYQRGRFDDAEAISGQTLAVLAARRHDRAACRAPSAARASSSSTASG